MNKQFLVYKITNIFNGHTYVGITTQTLTLRWRQHRSAARNGKQWPIARAIAKYGEDGFIVEELCCALTFDEMLTLESLFIEECRAEYNATSGGYHPKHKEETKQKIRNKKLGQKLSDEHKQRLSEARKGYQWSEERKQRMAAMLTARNKTERQRLASASKRGIAKGAMPHDQKEKLRAIHRERFALMPPDSHGYVSFSAKNNRWIATVKYHKKIYRKRFATYEDAERWRRQKSLDLYNSGG